MSENQDNNATPELESWKEFFSKDRFAVENGCRIVDAHPGYSKIEMEITDRHYNANGIVQGGALFTLADFAFAVAANVAGQKVVGISTFMNFFKATRTGVLTAIGKEVSRSRKLTTVEVQIFNEEGTIVAQFQGNGYILTDPK